MKWMKALLVLLCAAGTAVFLHFEDRLSMISAVMAFVCYFAASAVHLAAHEGGHFVGGLLTGYKLLCLRLGQMNIVMQPDGKVRFLWKKTHGGQCIMIPTWEDPGPFRAYNLGGVTANLLISGVSTLLLLSDSFYLSLLSVELILVGIYKILVNLIPHKTDSVPNDGYIVKLLKGNKAIQKDYAVYLKLYGCLFSGTPIAPDDYRYQREPAASEEELLYYNEIREILASEEASAPAELQEK